MRYEPCLLFGSLILLMTVFCAIRYGNGFPGLLRILGIGVMFVNTVLLLPLEGSISLSVLGGLQAGSLNASYESFLRPLAQEISRGNNAFVFRAYHVMLSTLLVLSPLLLGGMILSFSRGAMQQCKVALFARLYDAYYFSELNEHSLMLAGSISRAGHCLIVFCNILADNRFRDSAAKRGYVLLASSEFAVKRCRKRNSCFFEIAKEMTANLSGTKQLIRRFSQEGDKEKVSIFLFTDQKDAEILLDATDKHGLSVTIVNETMAVAYDLLFTQPLFRALQAAGENLSVLVAGAGRIGMEVVKAAAWCGQMDGVKLEIIVADRDAALIERQFRMECPELMREEYNIHFLGVDVRTDGLEHALNEYGRNVNYIVVCLGSDELNVKTALYLRGHYLRSSPAFNREPVICCQVSTEARAMNLRELTAVSREKLITKKLDFTSQMAQNYNIQPFGTYENTYSYGAIIRSPIDSLAINVNAVYEHTLGGDTDAAKILCSYYASEVNKRSSRANAVHIRYKLYMLGYEMIPAGESMSSKDLMESERALEALRKCLDDPARVRGLAAGEHRRWNAFQRSEGYRGASAEQAKTYGKSCTNGSHIHRRAKLHACVCSWEALPEVAEIFDQNILHYDEELIRHIPAIIGAEKNACINLGGARYMLKAKGDARAMPTA